MNRNLDFPESRHSKIKLVIIIAAAILLYGLFAGIRANTSILTMEISDFTGIPYGEVSLSFSILNLVLAISIPILGILTLKIQKFYMMFAGAIFCAIGFIGTAFSISPDLPFPTSSAMLILFIGVFFGFGASLLSFTIVYSAARPFVGEKASSIFAGVLLASQGLLGIVSAYAIDGFIQGFGLTLCLIIISVSAMCLVPVTFIFFQRKKNGKTEQVQQAEQPKESLSIGHALKKVVTSPFFYILLLASFAFGMGDGGLMNHTSQYITEIFDTDEYSPFIVSIYSISIMVGAVFGGCIGAKVKDRVMACGIIFLFWAIVNCIIQTFIVNNSFGLDMRVVTIFFAFTTGFLINATSPLLIAAAVERASVAATAVLLATIDFSIYIAYSFDSFIGGTLHDIFGDFRFIDIAVTTLAFIAGMVLLAYALKHRNKKPEIVV